MFLPKKFLLAGLAISLFAGVVTLAQQTQTSVQNPAAQQTRRPRMARRATQRRERQPMLRLLRQLNLTDQQKQQARSIVQGNLSSNQAQRQELRQLKQQWRQGTLSQEGLARSNELRKQLRERRKATRDQLASILTPEQRTRLEEIIRTRRANHETSGQSQRPN